VRWPWSRKTVAEELAEQAEAAGLAELERRRAVQAQAHLEATGKRIAARWAAAELEIAAKREAADRQPLRPLKWVAR
jgi:hypothetical protein